MKHSDVVVIVSEREVRKTERECQCQFSALTAANTLVLLCKQPITGGKYTPTKWREERHCIRKIFLLSYLWFSNSFAL